MNTAARRITSGAAKKQLTVIGEISHGSHAKTCSVLQDSNGALALRGHFFLLLYTCGLFNTIQLEHEGQQCSIQIWVMKE